MTRSNDDDAPVLWLKQAPLMDSGAEGIWSQALLPAHRTIRKSIERPRETVDAVTHCRLLRAVEVALTRHRPSPANPEMLELERAYRSLVEFRQSGKDL